MLHPYLTGQGCLCVCVGGGGGGDAGLQEDLILDFLPGDGAFN